MIKILNKMQTLKIMNVSKNRVSNNIKNGKVDSLKILQKIRYGNTW